VAIVPSAYIKKGEAPFCQEDHCSAPSLTSLTSLAADNQIIQCCARIKFLMISKEH
jgi:hypothetical protein